MNRTPTQYRDGGGNFAPLAQAEPNEPSESWEPGDDVEQRWENLTAKERFRSHIQHILRQSSTIEEEDDEEGGILQAQYQPPPSTREAAYAPVQELIDIPSIGIPSIGPEALDIAELCGSHVEYYAPTYPAEPPLLSDTRADTEYMGAGYTGAEYREKFYHCGPHIVTVDEVDEQEDPKHPPQTTGPGYRPFALSTTFLVALFLAVAVLLALTEVAIQELPDSTNSNEIGVRARNVADSESQVFGDSVRRSHAWGHVQARQNGTTGAGDPGSDGEGDPASTTSTTSTSTSSTSTSTTSSTTLDIPSTTTTQTDNTPTVTSDSEDSKTHTEWNTETQATTTATTDGISTTTTTAQTDEHTGGGHTRTQDTTTSTEDSSGPTGGSPGQGTTETTSSTTASSSTSDTPQQTQSGGGQGGGQGDGSTTDSTTTTTAGAGDGSPTPDQPTAQSTCTSVVLVTQTVWSTIDVTTVGLGGIGLLRRTTGPVPNNRPRDIMHSATDGGCDVTITTTSVTTVTQVTVLSTVTAGQQTGGDSGGSGEATSSADEEVTLPGEIVSTIVGQVSSVGAVITSDLGELSSLLPTGTDGAAPPQSTPILGTGGGDGVGVNSTTTATAVGDGGGGDATATAITTTAVGGGDSGVTTTATAVGDGGGDSGVTTTATAVGDGGGDSGVTTTATAVGDGGGDSGVTTTATAVGDGGGDSATTTAGNGGGDNGATTTAGNGGDSGATATATTVGNIGGGTGVTTATVVSPTDTAIFGNGTDTTVVEIGVPPVSTDQASDLQNLQPTTTADAGPTPVDDSDDEETLVAPTITTIPLTTATTVVNIIENSTIVNTIATTITQSAAPDTNNNVELGDGNSSATTTAVIVTHILQTTIKAVTRLVTQNIIYGDLTNSADGTMATWVVTLTDSNGVPTGTTMETKYGFLATVTLTDKSGKPTATTTQTVLKDAQLTTYTDASGKKHTKTFYKTTSLITMTNSRGQPTRTATLEITETPTVVTLWDASHHHVTGTLTQMVPDGTSTITVMVPAPSQAANSSSAAQELSRKQQTARVTHGQYFVGLLLPTLLAVAIAVPVRVLDQNIKLFLPFSALTVAYGADTDKSLCLDTTGLWGLVAGAVAPLTSNALLLASGLLVVTSAALVALSTEVLRFGIDDSTCTSLSGSDSSSSSDGATSTSSALWGRSTDTSTSAGTTEARSLQLCPAYLSIVPGAAQAVVGLFCLMALLVLTVAMVLRRRARRNPVRIAGNPWTLANLRELAGHPDMELLQNLLPKNGRIKTGDAIRDFGRRRYALNWWWDDGNRGGSSSSGNNRNTIGDLKPGSIHAAGARHGRNDSSDSSSSDGGGVGDRERRRWRYGIMMANDGRGGMRPPAGHKNRKESSKQDRRAMPFFTLGLWSRGLFLLLQLGLLLVILLYNNSGGGFQTFMNSQRFGGRFVLALAGVVVSLWWWAFFTCVAFISPYRLLDRRPMSQKPEHLAPPSNPFSGLWRVVTRRHPDTYLGFVALAAILSDVLPVFLANVPYEAAAKAEARASTVCTWLAASVLCIMVLLVIWSFLIRCPSLVIDPSTIAGGMYYATDHNRFLTHAKKKSKKSEKPSPV